MTNYVECFRVGTRVKIADGQAGCVYEVTITEWWGYEEYYVRISDVRQVL